MTTVLAIRDKSGVHIASDSKGTARNGEINKRDKFISLNNGYLAFAGKMGLASMFAKILTTDEFVEIIKKIDLSISTKEQIRSYLDVYTKKFGKLWETNLPASVKDGSIKQFFKNLAEDSLTSIIYIDANRMIKFQLSFENEVLKVISFEMKTFYSDSYAIYYIGSGSSFAYDYYKKYKESGYSLYETMKNSIIYAMTKDSYTGLDVVIAER